MKDSSMKLFNLVVIVLQLLAFSGRSSALSAHSQCGLNGDFDTVAGRCKCNAGWRGPTCSEIDLLPASPARFGLHDSLTPTWGGGAVFQSGAWHLIVGARAEGFANYTLNDYYCDSNIVHAVSEGDDPAGPYRIVETLFPRSSWEPALARGPNGELLLMFFGNMTNPPPLGSKYCLDRSLGYNLTAANMFITVSKSGNVSGPWTKPIMVKGMENALTPEKDPHSWRCCTASPSPAWHPNGTLFAAVRHVPCWRNMSRVTTGEHIGLWRADNGWDGEWVPVSDQPVYGWGEGGEGHCYDSGNCSKHEDPHLWWDERGAHLLTHYQNNWDIYLKRGGYGWSLDGHNWVLETVPVQSNVSVWSMDVRWTNGSVSNIRRRQRPSFIRDVDTGKPTHLLNGADFGTHSFPGICEGCHWGTALTLIQPINTKQQPAG